MDGKTRKILIISISLILIIFGIVIYIRYTKSPTEEKQIENNYYSSEFLFNNNYIVLANSINDAKTIDKDLDIHSENNTLYINLNNLGTEINNVPSNSTIYFNHLDNDCYEFAALVKNDLYYADTCLSNKDKKSFEKISSNAKSIYSPDIYKNGIYVNDNPVSNFIIDTTKSELKYISYENNTLGLYDNIEDINPYFDYVCASSNTLVCKNLMVYKSFTNELIFKDKVINRFDNKKITVSDLFSILKVDTDGKISIENLDYKNLNKYNYQFEVYVLDNKNYLYELDITKDNLDKTLVLNKKLDKKVKLIDYKKDKDGNINEVIVTDISGKTINFIKNNKTLINTSTIYERKSLIDTLK